MELTVQNAKADLERMFPDEQARCEVCGKWLKIKELLEVEVARQPATICRACAEDFEDGRYIRLR
jgi:ribosome-binding protein aMBF1 (putative translation factor)